jgi:outer membrane protein OmpA-like peptidoglycan-associated protein
MRTARPLSHCIAIALIGITIFLQQNESLFAGRRDDVKSEIEEAKSYMKALDDNTDVHAFIPFQNYYNAKVYLDTAVYQFVEEREYDASSFYAVLASVEIRTTHLIAKARCWQQKKLGFERDLMKDIVATGSRQARIQLSLAESQLRKCGALYRAVLFDFNMFALDEEPYPITPAGRGDLDRIARILQSYPRSTIKIIGHSRMQDEGNKKSLQKAQKAAAYLSESKGISARRITSSGAGNQYPMEIDKTIVGIDRIEIEVSGIN